MVSRQQQQADHETAAPSVCQMGNMFCGPGLGGCLQTPWVVMFVMWPRCWAGWGGTKAAPTPGQDEGDTSPPLRGRS